MKNEVLLLHAFLWAFCRWLSIVCVCLWTQYKWFSTSNASTCPLCRNLFWSKRASLSNTLSLLLYLSSPHTTHGLMWKVAFVTHPLLQVTFSFCLYKCCSKSHLFVLSAVLGDLVSPAHSGRATNNQQITTCFNNKLVFNLPSILYPP